MADPVGVLAAPPEGATRGPDARAPSLTAGTGSDPGWHRSDQRLVSTLVVLLVLTQRIGVPVGDTSISVALPISYVVIGALLVRGRLAVSRLRGELYLLAVTAVLAVTAAVSIGGGTLSLSSLMLLLVIYLPWTLRVAGSSGRQVTLRAGRTFVRVMVVVAAVAVVQFVAQLTGWWTYEDYLGEWLPPELLVPDYNTSIPLVFGSETFKANAFVMLEPSALSQFCALAVVIGLMLRARAWQVLILAAGLASAVSGTGIILLVSGIALMLVRAPWRIRPAYLLATSVGAVGLLVWTPAGGLLLNRSDEVAQPDSSGYARFVAPYLEVREGLASEPVRYLIGAGPGTVERLLTSNRNGMGVEVLYSVIPKLAFEYGLIAGGLVALFVLAGMLDRAPWRVVPATAALMIFFLSGALLQPQTAFLAWILTGLGSTDDPSTRQVPRDAVPSAGP